MLLYLSILVLSGVGIAYEIALMRLFSVAQWHHFAYMMISIALLGFGASGTLLSLCRRWVSGREREWLCASALCFTLALVLCTSFSQKIPFETFELLSQRPQLVYLFALYIILSIPFFCLSNCIALSFLLVPGRIGKIYFFNMLGSGLGAAGVVGLMYAAKPEAIPTFLALFAGAASLLLLSRRPRLLIQAALFLALFFVIFLRVGPAPVRLSQYKVLSYTLLYPDAAIIAQKQSPLSVLTAVSSKQIRETPGQIANYPFSRLGPLPDQIGLFFDGGSISVVNRFDGDLSKFAYLDYVTAALPYKLLTKPQVCVIGAGGGTDVLAALYHGATRVTAVEVDPAVYPLLAQPQFQEFSGSLTQRTDVVPVVAEGRGFLQSHGDMYDLIQISLLDAFNASTAGVHALSESYLYTKEAVRLYLSRLSPNGILAVTRWVKNPPRDVLKMFATFVEACEEAGIAEPARHVAFVRSWNTATLLLSRAPWADWQIDALRRFCQERSLDPCYFPGITAEETNRFTVLQDPIYLKAAQSILSSKRDKFYRDYLFEIRPSTDDRPYFFQFFKWKSLPRLIEGMGREWIPFVEWGYLILVATIVQGAVASSILIILPLFIFARVPETRGVKKWVVSYFAALGLAYMFLEIAFIQKFMLFLAYPVYAVAVVLAAFLVFSGLGSFFADKVREWVQPPRFVGNAILAIALLALLQMLTLPPLFSAWAGWPDWAKIAISLFWLAPLAFFMGIPFPTGMQLLSEKQPPLIPWAWGVNGCASVMGALLATFFAIHFGFKILVVLAILIYGLATAILRRLEKKT